MLSKTCPSCSSQFTGKFCSSCGEKQVSSHDFTLHHFVEETIEGFTHFDNKFLRSIRTLLFKPGILTRYFEQGRKVPYMKPVQLFIVCNLIFFLVVRGTNIFAIGLRSYISVSNSQSKISRTFYEKFGQESDLPRIEALFQEKMINQSKAFIVLFIPLFALACALFFLRRKKPIGLHLVFASHFLSFLLLFFSIFYLVFELPDKFIFHFSAAAFEQFASTLNMIVLAIYFSIAARTFYKINWVWAGISGVAACATFIILLQAYRIFLFFNILRTLQ